MSDATRTTESRLVIAILSACNFVIGMGAFVVISIIESLAEGLSVPVAAAGGLLTVYAMSYAVLSPLLVSLTGRLGRRRVLCFGFGLFAASTLLVGLTSSFAVLVGARVAAAAGAGLVTPVAAAIAAALSPPERRGKTLAAVFFGLTLAQVLGIPAGSWIAYTYGWQVAFLTVAALSVPCLWLVWTQVPKGLTFQPTTLVDLGRVLRSGVLMGSILFTASFLGAIYVLFTFLPPLLSQSMGYGRDGIALVLLTFGSAAVVGNLMGGWLTDRFGPMRTLTALCLCQAALMPVFSLLPLPGAVVLALVSLWSLFGWSFTAPQQIRVISLAPEKASVLLALNAAAIHIGIAVGSALGGVVLEGWGVLALGFAAGIAAVGALVHLRASHRAAAGVAARP